MSDAPHWLKMFLSLTSSHLHTCAVLLDLAFLPFYFDLSFTVFFHSSVLMHPEPHTDLDNLNTVEHNLRNSTKGSNDAYDVTLSLTKLEAPCWSSDIVSTEKLGAIMWSTYDVRSSQERQSADISCE